MVETVAVYWEEQIKIYGISVKPDLPLLTINTKNNETQELAQISSKLAAATSVFIMAAFQRSPAGRLDLVLPTSEAQKTITLLEKYQSKSEGMNFTITDNVHMLSIHGPHFQDRFGIAEVAFSALEKEDIPVLLSCCTGTSLQLLISEAICDDAVRIMRETFIIPTSI